MRKVPTTPLGVLSYILHQASTAYLPPHLRTSVVTDLSPGEAALSHHSSGQLSLIFPARRRQSGVEVAQLITDMYRTQPNYQWLDTLRHLGENISPLLASAQLSSV